MLSINSLLDAGKIVLGMIVGFIAIFFNQTEHTEMKDTGKFLGLRTTAYSVPDIKAAKEWYSNAFQTEPYFDEDFYVGFSIGGYELGLFPQEQQPESGKIENVLSYWGVIDVEETYQYLIGMGATEGDTPRDVGDGIIIAHVFDPWGNAVGLIYNPHFKLPESDGNEQVVEWAPFKLKEGVSDAELKQVSEQLQERFLTKQNGFVRRELLKKADGSWVDVVYWETKEDAEAAIQNAGSSEVCGEYFGLMEINGEPDAAEGVDHLEIVQEY